VLGLQVGGQRGELAPQALELGLAWRNLAELLVGGVALLEELLSAGNLGFAGAAAQEGFDLGALGDELCKLLIQICKLFLGLLQMPLILREPCHPGGDFAGGFHFGGEELKVRMNGGKLGVIVLDEPVEVGGEAVLTFAADVQARLAQERTVARAGLLA
jgi:hypothetical protein